MSATNMTIATTKPCMHYDCTYTFAGLKKPTAVDAEAIRNKQYNYSGAIVSHGESAYAYGRGPRTDATGRHPPPLGATCRHLRPEPPGILGSLGKPSGGGWRPVATSGGGSKAHTHTSAARGPM